MMWDVEKIRRDLAVLSQSVNGMPLVYLDIGVSSLMAQSAIIRKIGIESIKSELDAAVLNRLSVKLEV